MSNNIYATNENGMKKALIAFSNLVYKQRVNRNLT